MGFNGYNDEIQHTAFNPLAWDDQNEQRMKAWQHLIGRPRVSQPSCRQNIATHISSLLDIQWKQPALTT